MTAKSRARRPVVILASQSPRRRALLAALGVRHRVVRPRVDEVHDPRLRPSVLVRLNARLKAEAVARTVKAGVIVAADTVVVLGTRYFGKPKDADDATSMLGALSGRTHRVYTGVCIIDTTHRRRWLDVAVSAVSMRSLSDAWIATYVAQRRGMDKAGGYALQDPEAMLVDQVSGSLSNVIGMPLAVVERRLRACGVLAR
jgi:septum formation protein